MIGTLGETYVAKQNRSDEEKNVRGVYYYVYLYEEFQNNLFVRKKVRFEELVTRNVSILSLFSTNPMICFVYDWEESEDFMSKP